MAQKKSCCKIHIETLGCRVNQIESESIARSFLDSGFSVSETPWTASEAIHSETFLCIVNTCTVTQKAEQKARRIIRMLLNICPNACVLVIGCYAQLDANEIKKLDSRVSVLQGQKKDALAELPQFIKKNERERTARTTVALIEKFILSKSDFSQTTFALSTDTFLIHSRSSIKIQDGCNNSCSFCRIHLARGKSVSLAPEKILERVALLENSGQAEVVLTGVNLTQYCGKLGDEILDLTKLLSFLLSSTKSISFRLSSLYPQIITEEFCKTIASPRIRPHFHISVQSGSDAILQKMNRPYTSEDVRIACEKLRAAKPDCFIACDIITGFPGETEEDFLATEKLCRDANFAFIHAFPFSSRPGTTAANMKPKIPQSVSGMRVQILSKIAAEQKRAYIKSLVGKPLRAVVEKESAKVRRAVTENFLHVQISNAESIDEKNSGEVTIKITSENQTEYADCVGEIV